MSLTAKEKVQLRRQSKKKIMPTGLFLYHPASDRWIPAQADEEGRLVIDPSDLDTRYDKQPAAFLCDGSRLATGHWTVFDVIPDQNNLRQIGTYAKKFAYGGIVVLYNNTIEAKGASWNLYSDIGAASYLGFRVHSGEAHQLALLMSYNVGLLAYFDLDFNADSLGVVLTDRTTATKYRLYVDAGVLGIEAV